MDVINVCRFGFVIVLGTFVLMIWVSLSAAREVDLAKYPPCFFSSFCTCSKPGPELGIVRCENVNLPRIPDTVNQSKVFVLHLENNNLRVIEPYFLQSTGLYKIVISNNQLSVIPDETFLGLERSLWELDLSYNHLTRVPNRALRYLRKLRLLDLRGNSITQVSTENWRGLENSLLTLILTDNSITHLPTDAFSGLPKVETIDLKGNNLKDVDSSVFRDGMDKLANLILADNQLTAIPYQALSYLKSLKTLDLSHNKINKMQPAMDVGVQNVNYDFHFNLDLLKLDYNQISILSSASFQYFNVLNRTYLDGNSLAVVEENAFRQAKMRELYMRSCGLQQITPLAFAGLEEYLEVLDLSGNHISQVTEEAFNRFQLLRTLSIRDNALLKLDTFQTLTSLLILSRLEVSGSQNPVFIQDLRRFKNLRVLSVSRLSQPTLTPDDFQNFGIDLEELEITAGNLQTVKNNAFKFVHGLRKLFLTDNSISSIESEAFAEIGESLQVLKLSHGLSSSVQTLPSDSFKKLISLEELDLSNNRVKNMPATSFHFLKKLKRLHLQDNVIEILHKGTFQHDIHEDLVYVDLSFNYIRTIQQHTFAELFQVEEIRLEDNRIESLDRRAFMNLDSLRRVSLKGNKLTTIAYEAFQNIPELEDLDLAYNSLTVLDFTIFDQVGTLSMFRVNVSHNNLVNLALSPAMSLDNIEGVGIIHANIKVLDLSSNNISSISKQFFKPVERSLSHLHLGRNRLLNATKEVFGNMPQLQLLDLSYNSLYELDFDTFRNTKRLQVLLVSNNRLAEIPNDLFRRLISLRIVDFSHNRLRSLPDNLFREASLERLDVSHNLLAKLPIMSLSIASAETLCELDLSWNSISSLSHGGLLTRFKSLSWLDLSYNRLGQIDAGVFNGIPRLANLNLGHNSQLSLEVNGLSFQGLEYTLLYLNLDNVSLSQVPTLSTPNLLTLSLAFNSLPVVSSEIASNMSSLRHLNLAYNDLSVVPLVTHSLTELRYLSMEANPITTLTNTSLLGTANQLQELDLRNVDLTTLETGALCKMQSLRTLKIDLYKSVKNFNIPTILHFSDGLKNLEIQVGKDVETIENEMRGQFPVKLHNLTLSGKGLKKLHPKIFEGITSAGFQLNIYNTSISKISQDVFQNMVRVRNLSLEVKDNPLLKNLQNPSTGGRLNQPTSVFLTNAKLTGNKWSCDCDLGWVEVWQRKRRQYICGYSSCDDDDLRTSLCTNKNNRSLMEVLKTDIECGWSSAPSKIFSASLLVLVLLLLSV